MGDIGTRKNEIAYEHQSNSLTNVTLRIGGKDYLAQIAIRPSTPTITSVTTTDTNWTEVATGLTNILEWRLSELDGNDFDYAFVAAPGDNFSTAFGWVAQQTNPSAIYIKRKGTNNITIKFERWAT